jgi:hypothetical protein
MTDPNTTICPSCNRAYNGPSFADSPNLVAERDALKAEVERLKAELAAADPAAAWRRNDG